VEQSKEPKRKSAEIKASAEGKNVSEAYALALKKLEERVGEPFDREEAEVIVISEGSKGFLGMGAQVAKVEVRLEVEEAPAEPGAAQEAAPEQSAGMREATLEAERRLEEYLKKVLDAMGLEGRVFISEEADEIVGKVDGDDLGLFIGRHGQTIDAIQYLANVISFRKLPERKRIIIDAEDYRNRRKETLHSIADRAAGEVLSRGKRRYELKPMSAAERRVVHVHLQDRDGVETTSEGEEPYRRVVITRAAR
jgi:spoIIIJ-associated protein